MAPLLQRIHALLAAAALWLCITLGVKHGTSFSHGLSSTTSCFTRLRIEVASVAPVDKARLKALGATGTVVIGNSVQSIIGTHADARSAN